MLREWVFDHRLYGRHIRYAGAILLALMFFAGCGVVMILARIGGAI